MNVLILSPTKVSGHMLFREHSRYRERCAHSLVSQLTFRAFTTLTMFLLPSPSLLLPALAPACIQLEGIKKDGSEKEDPPPPPEGCSDNYLLV